uniref:Uncharacterized protein n=1 Tax=Ciona savignyi TaxID=51511 RepID=H2Z5B2_CIOSA
FARNYPFSASYLNLSQKWATAAYREFAKTRECCNRIIQRRCECIKPVHLPGRTRSLHLTSIRYTGSYARPLLLLFTLFLIRHYSFNRLSNAPNDRTEHLNDFFF